MQRADPRRAGVSIVGHGRGRLRADLWSNGAPMRDLKKYWSKRQRVHAVQYSQDIDRGEAEKEMPGRRLKADRDACHNPCTASASVQNAMHSLVFRPAFSPESCTRPLIDHLPAPPPVRRPRRRPAAPLPGHCRPPGSPGPHRIPPTTTTGTGVAEAAHHIVCRFGRHPARLWRSGRGVPRFGDRSPMHATVGRMHRRFARFSASPQPTGRFRERWRFFFIQSLDALTCRDRKPYISS